MKVAKQPISKQEAAHIEQQLKAHADQVAKATEGGRSSSPAGKPQDKAVKNNEGSHKQSARLHEVLHGAGKRQLDSEYLQKPSSPKISIDAKRVSALVAKAIDGKTEGSKPAAPAPTPSQSKFLLNSSQRIKALQAGHGRFDQAQGRWMLDRQHTAKPATVRNTSGSFAKPQAAGKSFHQAPALQVPRS